MEVDTTFRFLDCWSCWSSCLWGGGGLGGAGHFEATEALACVQTKGLTFEQPFGSLRVWNHALCHLHQAGQGEEGFLKMRDPGPFFKHPRNWPFRSLWGCQRVGEKAVRCGRSSGAKDGGAKSSAWVCLAKQGSFASICLRIVVFVLVGIYYVIFSRGLNKMEVCILASFKPPSERGQAHVEVAGCSQPGEACWLGPVKYPRNMAAP